MAEPTCVNCNRPASACRSFESKDCWVARALMLDGRTFRLEAKVAEMEARLLLATPGGQAQLRDELLAYDFEKGGDPNG